MTYQGFGIFRSVAASLGLPLDQVGFQINLFY